MSYDSTQVRIQKGQAYNLAVQTALANGRGEDNEYILSQFLRHLQFAMLVQKATPDQLAAALENPELLDIIKQLDTALEGKDGKA